MVRTLLKPKVIIYRFIDVLISKGRIKDDYIKIVSDNLLPFLRRFWEEPELLQLIDQVRQQSYEDRDDDASTPLVFKEIQNPKAIMDSLAFYISYKCKKDGRPQTGTARKPHNRLIRLVVLCAFVTGRGVITIHENKAETIKQRHKDNIQQFILSSVTATKYDNEMNHMLAYTSSGDLTPFIECFLTTFNCSLESSSAYEQLINMSQAKPDEILFMSSNADECRAAQEAGLRVVKVKLPNDSQTSDFLRIRDITDVKFVIRFEKKGKRPKSRSKQKLQQVSTVENQRRNSRPQRNSKIKRNPSKNERKKSKTKSKTK